MKTKLFPAVLLFSVFISTVPAADWPHWRGPEFNGSSPETSLPTEFSSTNNVKWIAELPGPSAATPIIWRDHVFISSTDTKAGALVALAFDRKSGKQLWKNEIAPGIAKDERSNFASPSPVTDGKLVVFYYGNGALAAFDFGGKQLWARNIEKDYGQFAFQWTYGASPTLCEGKLFIQVLQRDVPVNGRGRTDGPIESYLLALDPATGKELWRHVRPSDARGESREAFTTPIPYALYDDPGSGQIIDNNIIHPVVAKQPIQHWQLLIVGGDCITGHDAKTGKELWRWETWNPGRVGGGRLVASSVVGGGVALALAPRGISIHAVKLGGGRSGLLTDEALAWKIADKEIGTDVSTPAFYQGKFYVINSDKKLVLRLDPATGKPDWTGQLDSRAKVEGSPTVADGKLYFQNHVGEVFVVGTGNEFKILHRVAMGDSRDRDTRSTVGVSSGNLFIRTAGKLYCVGK